jgi:hypothetical protein
MSCFAPGRPRKGTAARPVQMGTLIVVARREAARRAQPSQSTGAAGQARGASSRSPALRPREWTRVRALRPP